MSTISDLIEKYLCDLLCNEGRDFIELHRRELAKIFHCAPSQINYVLETRFTLEHGYHVESRRGEGGYIRITKVSIPRERAWNLGEKIGDAISEQKFEEILAYLQQYKIFPSIAISLIRSITEEATKRIPPHSTDEVRAKVLRNLLLLAFELSKSEVR